MGLLGRDLGVGIGHGEDDRLRRHALHHRGAERTLGREAEEDVGALDRLGQCALGGRRGMGGLPLVHAGFPALVDDPLGVAEEHVLRLEPHSLDEIEAGDAGRTRAVADERRFLDVAARELHGVQHAGRRDDGGAVLVVMEDRNVHEFAQAILDDEAFRRLDVFEVDAAERRPEIAHRRDERVRIFGIDFEIDGIDVGEALEQHRLAFHHGLRGQRSEVAEPEDGGAVRDDRHHVALGRVVIGPARILVDGLHRHGDAGRIGQRQVALGRHGLRRDDLELAGPTLGMELERFLVRDRAALGSAAFYVVHCYRGPVVACQGPEHRRGERGWEGSPGEAAVERVGQPLPATWIEGSRSPIRDRNRPGKPVSEPASAAARRPPS